MGRFGIRIASGALLALSLCTVALARGDSRAAQQWLGDCYMTLPPLSSECAVYQDENACARAGDIFVLTNEWRDRKGAPPVMRDPHLDAIAQAHAADMARQDYFEHDSPQGMDVFDRIECTGAPEWWTGGENLAAGYRTPDEAVDSWMNSKGHKKNLLNKDYDYVGIGVYYQPGTEYGWYWVQVFCSFRGDPASHDWLDPGESM